MTLEQVKRKINERSWDLARELMRANNSYQSTPTADKLLQINRLMGETTGVRYALEQLATMEQQDLFGGEPA